MYLFLIIIFIYLSEIGSFCWHKYGTHENFIPRELGVQNTHQIHHTVIDDQAHADFFYILFMLIILGFFLWILFSYNFISYQIGLSIYCPVTCVFVWNWYIHSAYHIDNHWLNKYEWFRNDKRIHFQHHANPNVNFGIATHFSDIIMDTFDSGLLKDI